MFIRVAEQADMATITDLARSLKLNNAETSDGFLVYVLEEAEYDARLNPFFTVAEQNGLIVGFLMCYSDQYLRRLMQNNRVSHEDGIMNFLQKQEPPFLYGDQIGVWKGLQRSSVGKQLLHDMCLRIVSNGIYHWFVSVLHGPVVNQTSIEFVSNFGFGKVGEIQNQDGFVFGMYHLDLSRTKKVDEFENKPQF